MNPYEYKCPIDGEIFTGEPYEGAWWRLCLEKNKIAAFEFAIAYVATEDRKYLDIVHTILLGYAKYYHSRKSIPVELLMAIKSKK